MILKDGARKLCIYVTVRCKEHPTGRIQYRRVFEGVELGSQKAKTLERDLLREAEREKAQREVDGTTWKFSCLSTKSTQGTSSQMEIGFKVGKPTAKQSAPYADGPKIGSENLRRGFQRRT
jgi:hypothetical protein